MRVILLTVLFIHEVYGRNRSLSISGKFQNDISSEDPLSKFGYLKEGQLFVNVTDLSISPPSKSRFGFVLEKYGWFIVGHERSKQMEAHICRLNLKLIGDEKSSVSVIFWFSESQFISSSMNDSLRIINGDEDCQLMPSEKVESGNATLVNKTLASSSTSLSFKICFDRPNDEGEYSLKFVMCNNSATSQDKTNPPEGVDYSFKVNFVEQNKGPNYLPAGEMALPGFYACMSIIFGGAGLFWIVFLCRHEETVFKIHYLMFLLMVLKTLSLMFHSVDYHFIAVEGSPMQAFAVLFYITYLTKGALLFSVLALIGSGWAFIKPVLSDKEKKIFVLVIPMQILANVAYIITETTEEGGTQYQHWRKIFLVVDLLCCVAILYPVVWSVRHLQIAALTDGKAAIGLRKLKLFRQFYTMIVCYFYSTRIISLVLKAALSFRYAWIHEVFFEGVTLLFFVVTAHKFRPGSDNPYLQLQSEDEYEDEEEETELEEVTMQSGVSNGLIRKSHNSNHMTNHVT